MLFAKIAEDGTVLKWPVTEPALRIALSNITFPPFIQEEHLVGTGYVMVPTLPENQIPQETADQMVKLSSNLLLVNGKYVRQYDLIDVPAELKDKRLSKQWVKVRKQRDELMLKHGWRVARHARERRLGLTPKENLATVDGYMQALADITDAADPFLIQWPEEV